MCKEKCETVLKAEAAIDAAQNLESIEAVIASIRYLHQKALDKMAVILGGTATPQYVVRANASAIPTSQIAAEIDPSVNLTTPTAEQSDQPKTVTE